MDEMPTIASLRAEGEALGLKGDPLREFILNQQTMLRDERARVREFSQAKREAEAAHDGSSHGYSHGPKCHDKKEQQCHKVPKHQNFQNGEG